MKIVYQKITKLLGNIPDKVPKVFTKKWIEVHDLRLIMSFYSLLSNADVRYKSNKQIRFKTTMLQSHLYNHSNAYIIVKWKITVTGENNRDI